MDMPAAVGSSLESDRKACLLDRLAWITAALPLLWIALFSLYVLRARYAIGSWPRPYHPDPGDLGFVVHHSVLLVGLPVLFLAPIAVASWVLLARVWLLRTVSARHWFLLVGAIAASAGSIACLLADRGRFLEWFFD